jgi:tetratricopeptide (TPR) repeat protein
MRVNAQLIDAESGNHLWAERFDRPLADLFDMQDEVVARLANALSTQLVTAEARRAERAPNPDSMDLYFQGKACVNKGWSPQYVAQARRLFKRSIALDPGNVDALVGVASVDMIATRFYLDDQAARVEQAEATLTKALSLAPDHALAHMWMGDVQIFTKRIVQGIAECERALELDRNLALAHGSIGIAKIFSGRAEECEAHFREALRLSPRDNDAFRWLSDAGAGKHFLCRDEEAVAWLRRSVEANRNYPLAHFWLAAALGNLGRLEEARAAVDAGLALNPNFTIARYRVGAPSDDPTFLAQRERTYEGMRKAGVPEG